MKFCILKNQKLHPLWVITPRLRTTDMKIKLNKTFTSPQVLAPVYQMSGNMKPTNFQVSFYM